MVSRVSRATVGAGALIALVLFLASGCGDSTCPPNAPCPTPTPGGGGGGTCSNVTGTRNMFWSDSCGNKGSGQVVLTQVACTFSGNLTGLGTFAGTVSGNTLSYTLTFVPCGGTATGTATVSGSVVTGSYSGTQTGAAPCCPTVTGEFSFDFAPTPVATTPTPTPPSGVGFGKSGKR